MGYVRGHHGGIVTKKNVFCCCLSNDATVVVVRFEMVWNIPKDSKTETFVWHDTCRFHKLLPALRYSNNIDIEFLYHAFTFNHGKIQRIDLRLSFFYKQTPSLLQILPQESIFSLRSRLCWFARIKAEDEALKLSWAWVTWAAWAISWCLCWTLFLCNQLINSWFHPISSSHS